MTSVGENPQTSIGEHVVQNDELELQLEQREAARAAAAKARKDYLEIDAETKTALEQLDLDGDTRIGRFVITTREVAGRSVAFETQPSTRVTIKADE